LHASSAHVRFTAKLRFGSDLKFAADIVSYQCEAQKWKFCSTMLDLILSCDPLSFSSHFHPCSRLSSLPLCRQIRCRYPCSGFLLCQARILCYLVYKLGPSQCLQVQMLSVQEAQCAQAPSFVKSAPALHSGHSTILRIFVDVYKQGQLK
jgi:hypothetical protein